jgi:hypothetical protein
MTTTSPFRFGGWSGILAGVFTILAAALVVLIGLPPTDSEELLRYLSRLTAPWAAVAILGVAADVLILPFAYALYRALREDSPNLARAASGLLAVFALLDLAVRWPTYAALITLAGPWPDATTTELEALILSAGHATALIGSFLWPVYFTLIPGVGILLASVAWYRADLGRLVAYVGMAVGVLAAVTVLAATITTTLGTLTLVTSVAFGAWFAVAGFALTRLDRS